VNSPQGNSRKVASKENYFCPAALGRSNNLRIGSSNPRVQFAQHSDGNTFARRTAIYSRLAPME
jgi:hypothetical protein